MYLLLALAHQCMAWYIQPLILFSTINRVSASVSSSYSTSVIFRHACRANLGAEKNYARSKSFISMDLLSNTYAKSSV